jgi:antibiotic biosynthesis monooxygenase (ABM) superfamily enzyme
MRKRLHIEQREGWDMQSVELSPETSRYLGANLEMEPADAGPPVTVTIRQRVPAAKVESYLTWQQGIIAANREFPGFTNAALLRENLPDDHSIFVVILSYENFRAAEAWNVSDERKRWLELLDAADFCPGPATIAFDDGAQGVPVFSFSAGVLGVAGQDVPRWRAWLLVWIQVYTLVEFFEWLLPLLLGSKWGDLDLHLKFLFSTFCTTVTIEWMTFKPVGWLAQLLRFLPPTPAAGVVPSVAVVEP